MIVHDYAGRPDPRRAECGVLTDNLAGYSRDVTCKRCLAVRRLANRRIRLHAAEQLFGVLNVLRVYGGESLAEEVRRLAVALHNGTAGPMMVGAKETNQ